MNRQKFWTYTKPAANGCIEWTGCRDKNGYGKLKLDGAGMSVLRSPLAVDESCAVLPRQGIGMSSDPFSSVRRGLVSASPDTPRPNVSRVP